MSDKTTQPIKDFDKIEKLLIGVTDPRDRLFFNLSIFLALRVNETIKLKWNDLIKEGHPVTKITIIQSKGGKKRERLPVVEQLRAEIIRAYKSMNPHTLDDYVFKGRRGSARYKPISKMGIHKIMQKWSDILNVKPEEGPFSSHALRKTGAYWFYSKALQENSNEALKITMNWLGHSSIQNLLKYLGLDREAIERITDSMTLSNDKSPLAKMKSNEIQWKSHWKFLNLTSDSPESDMYNWLNVLTENVAEDFELVAALDYIKLD
jgi:integrase